MKKFILFFYSTIFAVSSFAQLSESDLKNTKAVNWHNLDWKGDRIAGTGVDRAYAEFLKNKKAKNK